MFFTCKSEIYEYCFFVYSLLSLHNMIRDYDKKDLEKKDPKLFLEKWLLYGWIKGQKLKAKMLYKYLPQLNIPKETKDYYQFLIDNAIKSGLLKV